MNIEELDLDIKVYNRLKKNLPDVRTANHLIVEMYDEHGVDKVSAPDMKAIEKALKDKGIFKYMRGDEVSEDDIEPTPLTWDELHQYVGGLVVCDDSTESHRWLHLCWIYSISDEGDTSMMYLCRGNSYLCTRKQYVESDTSATVEMHGEMLRHSGHFFALKQHALRLDSLEDNWPHGDLFYYSDSPEAFGKELTYEELCALPANTQVLIDDTFDSDDEDEDLAAELWRKDSNQYSEGVRLECLDDDDFIQTQTITESMMTKRSTYYTRVFLKAGGAVAKAPKPKADIIPQEPAQVIVPDDYSRAITLTRSIIANAQAAQHSMWEVCKGLNEMKERKLYKEIGYGVLTFNGQAWDNMSGSEQLKCAAAIVRKLNPECGFVLMDKLEQMDMDTLKDFGAWLEQEGLQVLATRVSTGDECAVIIEDGYSHGNNTAPAAVPAEPKTWKAGEF